ncbi:putative trihelix transcription factor GTL1 [Iris pallida]|uniref:Trihelix transcription factor GTL1 n=1 Tax=Iris pallida TaxID=29817 RepID=A0AAX6F0Q1_IRIPA|nr:putative trihelix transcription factor GTL1 [Iris pallida]
MHSGYGEQQQLFMVDGCPPNSFFSISPPPATTSSIPNQQKFYHLPTHQPQQQQHHQPLPPPPQFSHLIHPVPITQQLFHPHPFHLFHHHHSQLGMEHQPTLDNSSSPAPAPGPSSFLDSLMSFKLGVDVDASTAAAAGSGDHVLNEDDVHVLHGDDGSDGSRLHSWRREEEEAAATIKQPFWRPLDIDYINRNNKRPKSPENTTTSGANYSKKSREAAVFLDPSQPNTATAVADSNYKLFSELEAIYKPGSNDGGGGGTPKNNQAGSGSCSALTGDDNHPIHVPGPAICPVAINNDQFYHGSDTSDGGDAMPPPSSTNKSQKASSRRKQRAKRRQQEQAAAITAFFESLMKQVMDHQESLHCKFLQVMEKKDQERASREEASRKEEAARSAREAASRAQERALAASREAAIVSFLEKITGESLELPVESHKGDQECNAMELYNADCGNNSTSAAAVQLSNNRWPKAEVQALICVRSGLEPRFQEPGLKGPLWEEVSSTMETMGYRRSAKRCKEKWENINKYFRKAKDSGKKRSQRSKTCPYFQQLDQLYSMSGSAPPSSSIAGVKNEESSKDINNNHNNNNNNSELLDAIVLVSNDHQSFKFPEMGSDQVNEVGSSAMSAGKGRGNCGDEDDNEDRRDAEEGEGDGAQPEQGHEHQLHFREGGEDLQLHDSTFYFQRLRC